MAPRQPAPGDLELVRAFVNTVDLESTTDSLDSPEALIRFLGEHALAAEAADASDLARAIEVRESIRVLLDGNCCGEDPDPAAIERLNGIAPRTTLRVYFETDGSARLEPDPGGIDAALGKILAVVFEAMANGSWERLKACHRDSCRWIFYDRSKNRSSRWCSMDVCGNREKAKSYRSRHA